jgi:uncharacterized protein with HEPN domain
MTPPQDRSLRHRLDDIVEWSARLEAHISGLSEEEFLSDSKTQDAVIRCIICIGEAAKHIMANREQLGIDPKNSDFFQAWWARNRLAHGYFDIDAGRVWLTATASVPQLGAQAKVIIAERFGG